MRAAPELLGAPTIGGGVPGPGVVVERSYMPSQPYEIAKNGKKTGGFTHVLACNLPKTLFFALKYLTKYTHETFFEEYLNFKIFRNLSHCGVIPVRSFGSHIRPQPHGLGLSARIHRDVAAPTLGLHIPLRDPLCIHCFQCMYCILYTYWGPVILTKFSKIAMLNVVLDWQRIYKTVLDKAR